MTALTDSPTPEPPSSEAVAGASWSAETSMPTAVAQVNGAAALG